MHSQARDLESLRSGQGTVAGAPRIAHQEIQTACSPALSEDHPAICIPSKNADGILPYLRSLPFPMPHAGSCRMDWRTYRQSAFRT
jgi:hypothetical protein